MELHKETFAQVVDLANDVDMQARQYSGRGMYGSQCLAVVGTMTEFVRFIASLSAQATDDDQENLVELLDAIVSGRTSVDSMALETVFYWPNVEVVA